MRFDVNINTLFTEQPLLERFALVREAGFEAVESWWPTGIDLEAYASAVADADLEVVLINFTGGDLARGDGKVRSHRGRMNRPRDRAGDDDLARHGGTIGPCSRRAWDQAAAPTSR